MLLKIDFKPEDVVYNKNGRLILKVKFFSAFATAAHMCTVEGHTAEDFGKNKMLNQKNLFVGQRGAITT
jgi:hypothetical protein